MMGKSIKDVSMALLGKLKEADKVHLSLYDMDIQLGRHVDMDILDDVCDLLGVPEDTSAGVEIDQDTGEFLGSGIYCRDWVIWSWADVVDEKSTVAEFVESMIKEGQLQEALA
tara:strand:+ start:26 stop:364 length:339 start_codon:yes stop_codon:yes gene_type:complete